MNQYQNNITGRSNPSSYSSYIGTIKGGYSSTAQNYPIPQEYQKRIPGKILKVKVWKLSRDHDAMVEKGIANGIFKQVHDAIKNGVAR